MNRMIKLVINITVIIVLSIVLLYSNGYRFNSFSAAHIYTDIVYMDHPTLVNQNKIDQFDIYLFEEKNMFACSLVENTFPFIYKSKSTYTDAYENLTFYSWSLDRTDFSDVEIDQSNSQCVNMVDLYYNNNLKDLNKIGNALTLSRVAFQFDTQLYQVVNQVTVEDKYFFLKPDDSKTIAEYLNLYVDHNQLLHFTNYDSASISSTSLDKTLWIPLTRYDVNKTATTISLTIDLDYLDIDTLTVKEAYEKKDNLQEKLNNYFIDFQDLHFYEQLSKEELIDIVKKLANEIQLNIDVDNVDISIENTNTAEANNAYIVPTNIEEYAKEYQYHFVETEMSYHEIKELNYREVFDMYDELYRLIIKTSDGKYLQIFVSDFVNLGNEINIEDAYFKFSLSLVNVEDFNKAMETPNLLAIVSNIINDNYKMINTREEANELTNLMEAKIAEYLGINSYSVQISVVTPINRLLD